MKDNIQIAIDLLTTTLGQGISPEKADAIVRQVIKILYNTQ